MAGDDGIEVEGSVVEVLPHTLYWVELANGHRVLAHWRSQARRNAVLLRPGDRVRLKLSPFDLSKGSVVGNENEL